MSLSVASYNIHAGVGSDRRFRPHRLINVLQQLQAQVIGLQEVVSVGPDGFALLDELAQGCDMKAVAGPTLLRGDAEYGNALLTSLPIEEVKRIDLSVKKREPRGAVCVGLRTHAGPLTAVVTHLGLRGYERRRQATWLLKALADVSDPVVILGDFNEWWPLARSLRRLRSRFPAVSHKPSYPARLPLLTLDRILASPEGLIERVDPVFNDEARHASDHLPIRAELQI